MDLNKGLCDSMCLLLPKLFVVLVRRITCTYKSCLVNAKEVQEIMGRIRTHICKMLMNHKNASRIKKFKPE